MNSYGDGNVYRGTLCRDSDEKTIVFSEAYKATDCNRCSNKGKLIGASQETYCENCIHQKTWLKDYFIEVTE